nr:immunoglobulin heavy chain junction region [Macaca mulatta]MOV39271.1 immunoglobulin heavy chain junction region [Macaca mulatta]MOV40055.1 immunoglobulin heavy chain junction region [Macaca mulatta]MOV43738.1 immunoglobulin heavy chain junction region [Macaca mulatta]MOV43848.1 immunoglobulin heavy chain junction region [Macaca mulatta]
CARRLDFPKTNSFDVW